ncbi:AMP-binding protein [Mycolicibacterium flavescens]|uniref:AMP-dependent synthetase n=1 Tax=Mycolicibacterium flavescens TaxID=1776 RepID=A0A1E3RR08_MYCFV|nr:AMP-binding protein [Mycolicibacterium flavescens]MCV7279638.1 AMP-binding protein [Mycolicibacterium flavescens]ODQ92288.1 AMP-dependent synthetase [Mycolicibacterium flavescens]
MNRLLDHLHRSGERIAVHTDSQHLSYVDLAARVQTAASTYGDGRRLVLLETRNDVATLVHYLGALAGGHVVLPVPAGRDHTAVLQTYDPDIAVSDGEVHHRHDTAAHRLHPDLAMLLSTSGSTGSPKLVRLSYTNLLSNAHAISDYLTITENDVAATTLPMSYCYGLSVVNSHLLSGAGLLLTDLSVTDERFWESFRHHRATSFAGVPYTFELLERLEFDRLDLPDLRYITQAGGRMAPERVRRFAEYADAARWQLFVMYGATEATARMAYLAPELALTRPAAIGTPIPGGAFTVDPLPEGTDDTVGELVYRGPNVMLGYARGPADLALGKTVDALHTGDLARRAPDGLYEIVGRTSRFVKMYGLRIDLQRVETALSAAGISAFCADAEDRLVVAARTQEVGGVQQIAAEAAGVPASAVCAVAVDELPLLTSGKPDYPAVRALARAPSQSSATTVRDLFADVLQLGATGIDPDASFVDLGGNSLTYVTTSVRLERVLGRLPADWPQRPVRDLEAMEKPARSRRSWAATMETSVALRAAAIVLIVGSHAELFELWGGAHILLGIAGYNFGRFCLTRRPRTDRVRHLRNTIGWIAVPSVLWVALTLLLTDHYTWTNLLLANKILGPHDSMTAGRLWFVEVLVWTLVALALVFWSPAMDRVERQRPFALAVVFLVVGLALRYDALSLDMGRDAWFTMLAFWFFAIGWAASKATTPLQRVLLTAVLAVALHGYFDSLTRELLVFGGLALVMWLPTIRCPAALTAAAGVLAEASLYTYLVHYQVYALFPGDPLIGVLASLAVGILLTQLVTVARHRLRVRRTERRRTLTPAPR